MLKEIANTLCMENMPATKFDGGVRPQLTREANVAKIVLVRTSIVLRLAGWLKAG